MAILLTTSYQHISTISITYGEIRTYARLRSQSKEENKSYYDLKSTYYIPSYNNVSFSSATGTLDGETKGYGYTTMYKGETTIQEFTREISHNSDGSSPTKNVATSWTASFGGGGSTSADIVFPKIDRYPMLTSAPNFSDEDNPTITYTTTMGFSGATLSACISLTGATDDITYREIAVQDGSYTFNLTNAEREILRNATPNSNTLNVIFFLRTSTSTTSYYSTLTRQMTIVNGEPSFTHTELETDENVISVLGSSSADTIIQNVSKMKVTVVPTAVKGATITSVRVSSGLNYSQTKTTSPYEFIVPVTVAGMTITATDSRGNVHGAGVMKTLIEYTPVSLNSFSFKRENPTSSNIIVNLEATYLQKNFNNTANVPIVKWKLDDGSFTTIPSSEYSIDTTNNKLTITNYELSNALVYTAKGTFRIEVSDLFTSDSNTQDVIKGIPTFDYGEHDLQVNGDLYVADINRENPVNILERVQGKILWQNNNPSSSFTSQNITLSSDDYDVLVWYFKGFNNNNWQNTTQVIKGGNARLIYMAGTELWYRNCEYLNDTTYSIHNESTGNNTRSIPLYVIGYKTGLF